MANTYKNIVISPGINSSVDDPKIVFSGANTTTNTDITLRTYPTSSGTLSFEGTAGQLFSITNDLSGILFSVNDVSGIPSIEAYANGDIRLGEFSGNVSIGTANNSAKLFVNGITTVNAAFAVGNATITGFLTTSSYSKTTATTVASLVAAATAGAGARSFVTDSTVVASGNFGAIVAGTGANAVPVYSDGTNWRIG